MTDTTSLPSPHSAQREFAMLLDAEWQQLAARRINLTHANSWELTVPVRHLDDLLAAAGHAGAGDTSATSESSNRLLGEIVTLARRDQLAGRVVLQRILPGLRSYARRWSHVSSRLGVHPGDALTELVAAAWEAICRYDVTRRPQNVAANLVHDAVHRAFVGPSRRRGSSEQPTDPDELACHRDDREPSPSDELTAALVDAQRAGVDRCHLTLVGDLCRHDGSTDRVASSRGVTSRTVRNLRAQATHDIRAALMPAA